MDESRSNPDNQFASSIDAKSKIGVELWEHPHYGDLVPYLIRFMQRFPLTTNNVAEYTHFLGARFRIAVRGGVFTLRQINLLLAQAQERPELMNGNYLIWHDQLILAVYLFHQRGMAREERQGFWDPRVIRKVYFTLSLAYDQVKGAAASPPSLPYFERAWAHDWQWISIPKHYRLTMVEQNRFDLESTRPFALELGQIPRLGAGLRVESKGWGSGAYRVFRRSTEPLPSPREFEPALVHIPAGEFWMGEREPGSASLYRPEPFHKAYLDEYWIGRYPVTIAEFAIFVNHYGYSISQEELHGSDGVHWSMPYYQGDKNVHSYGRHPVTHVSIADARAYCRWLSEVTGKQYSLPSEAEWEKAARGADARTYPWGDRPPDRTLCNVEHWFDHADGIGTTPVGQFSPSGDGPTFDNPYGCADMAGTVAEWTLGTRAASIPYDPNQDGQPLYYTHKTYQVVRGGSWRRMQQFARSAACEYGFGPSDDIGFRVVMHPPSARKTAAQ